MNKFYENKLIFTSKGKELIILMNENYGTIPATEHKRNKLSLAEPKFFDGKHFFLVSLLPLIEKWSL